jgi:hypothetical protein
MLTQGILPAVYDRRGWNASARGDGYAREASMSMSPEAVGTEAAILEATAEADTAALRPSVRPSALRSEDIRMFGVIFVSNTTLFSALDVAQWLADRFDMSSLPTNMIAAVMATSVGVALTAGARWFGVADA